MTHRWIECTFFNPNAVIHEHTPQPLAVSQDVLIYDADFSGWLNPNYRQSQEYVPSATGAVQEVIGTSASQSLGLTNNHQEQTAQVIGAPQNTINKHTKSYKYAKPDSGSQDNCAICLSDFEESEDVR